MPLNIVSITGADDKVLPSELAALSARYTKPITPEWAILYFPEKECTPRIPSSAWCEAFLALDLPFTAVHLCGTQIFREILDPRRAPARIADISRYRRVQLNINARRPDFTEEEVLAIYHTLLQAGLHLILQYHDGSSQVIQKFVAGVDAESLSRIDLLYDASRGTGQRPEQWPPISTVGRIPLCFGYAGGLGPDVLEVELPRIHESATAWRDIPYWIDMESGVRSDNHFDLAKVRAVLEIAGAALLDLEALRTEVAGAKRQPTQNPILLAAAVALASFLTEKLPQHTSAQPLYRILYGADRLPVMAATPIQDLPSEMNGVPVEFRVGSVVTTAH